MVRPVYLRQALYSCLVSYLLCSHDFAAEKLHEYQWPQENKAEWYMLQEQVSDFLGVKSFKRKYPGRIYAAETSLSCIVTTVLFRMLIMKLCYEIV